jgi:hypothetical protein
MDVCLDVRSAVLYEQTFVRKRALEAARSNMC